ncbi:MAG: glycosyltransferase [Ferruginibacter sp.]|nr:glycosyltransferase [Ferruginibacter sp.]
MSDVKQVLFISYDGMTDPLGQSQVIPYLASLTQYGYHFTILSCDKPDKYEKLNNYVKSLIAPYNIDWVSILYHKNPPILSSVYDYQKLKQTAIKLHKQKNFTIVHTRVGLPQLVALHLKKKYGVKFMNDIRGFWADERVDGNMWNLKNPLYKTVYNFFKKKEDECVTIADYNTCLTHKAKKEILSWEHIPKQPVKVEVVPCSVDMELFNPEKLDSALVEKFRKELNISSTDSVISYLGSIGGWYLTKEMMKFCKLYLTKIPNAKFLFISNNNHQDIINAAAEFAIPADRIVVKMGIRHEVPALLSLSNYSLFFIKPCYSKMSSSPTKHGEIMAMGIPVITNSGVGDVKEIVEGYNAGYVIDTFTDDTMQNVVNSIASNTILFNANAIRNGAKEYYNLETTVATYKKVYEAMLQ